MAIVKVDGVNPAKQALSDKLKEYTDAVTKTDVLNKEKASPMRQLKEQVDKNNLEDTNKGGKINFTA
ncbi:hypothetical protein ACFL20_13450 [Spirochaetota bacterium]